MQKTLRILSRLFKTTDSICAMGHLELNGFRAHRGHVMEDGMACDLPLTSSTKCFQDTTIHGQTTEKSST